ncbi:MAG: hypothetical protein IH845_02655 [Nanoarchaeota archaeon]|nr:hypothetical protein [Nanoarchaeota archaeon]
MRAIIPIIILTVLAGFGVYFLMGNYFSEGEVIGNAIPGRYEPLSVDQNSLVRETILNSEFVSDIPKDNPISLRFYYFDGSERVWQDEFILADGQIKESGTPLIYLTMHTKYLENLENGEDLCDVVKLSKNNGELGFSSGLSETKLAWKYKSMLKHKECFGL